jgi:dihydrofolate synthase/folylpolyglutamate synthase
MTSNEIVITLGLQRISQILNILGNPQNNLKIIHVAGTNGKGSVCAFISNILTQSGYKCGIFIKSFIKLLILFRKIYFTPIN